ncbi:MAG: hypothetical protein KDM81_21445, partial [Verrucomicrobiae bacterium]|nr:hypothetical protein [Verrucomicrobiae bacterium]
GASSLAELAAMRVPPILIPYPTAVGNHQVHNARHFAEAGAARVIPQAEAAPERLLWEIRGLLRPEQARRSMADALTRRHHPAAARLIAERMWTALGQPLRQVDGGPDLDPAPDSIPSQPQRFPASS